MFLIIRSLNRALSWKYSLAPRLARANHEQGQLSPGASVWSAGLSSRLPASAADLAGRFGNVPLRLCGSAGRRHFDVRAGFCRHHQRHGSPGFRVLAEVENEHFWFVARNELIVGLANKFFPHARRFLEIGCGTGAVLSAMAASRSWARLVGSEVHPSGLAFARNVSGTGAELVQLDARNIPARGRF